MNWRSTLSNRRLYFEPYRWNFIEGWRAAYDADACSTLLLCQLNYFSAFCTNALVFNFAAVLVRPWRRQNSGRHIESQSKEWLYILIPVYYLCEMRWREICRNFVGEVNLICHTISNTFYRISFVCLSAIIAMLLKLISATVSCGKLRSTKNVPLLYPFYVVLCA